MTDDDQLIVLKNVFLDLAGKMAADDIEPLMIAAAMTTSGINLYKELLPPDDFKMMQKIIGTADKETLSETIESLDSSTTIH